MSAILMSCALVLSQTDVAVDRSPASQQELARYLLDGWKTERERVACGSVTVSGQIRRSVADATPQWFGGVSRRDIRFDRGKAFEEQVAFDNEAVVGYFARTSDATVFCSDLRTQVVSLYHPDARPYKTVEKCVFDWRAAGCFDSSGLEIDSHDYNYFHDRFGKIATIKSVTSAAQAGRYLLEAWSRCDTATQQGTLVERYTIDESAGFTIVARDAFLCKKGEEHVASETESPDLAVQCDWQKHADVWIPVQLRFREPLFSQECDIGLAWKAVNECTATEDTSLLKSVLPDSILVSDQRVAGGPALVLGRLGALRAAAMAPTIVDPPEPRIGRRGFIIWSINLAFLAGFGAWWVWRTLRGRRGAG